MLTFICIVSLIIVIIAIYQYRKLVVVEDTVERFNSGGYNWYGIPKNWKKDVLYIVVIADDYLDLYHNPNDAPTMVNQFGKNIGGGRARCCGRAYRFEIKNFQQGHKLMLFNYNGGGPVILPDIYLEMVNILLLTNQQLNHNLIKHIIQVRDVIIILEQVNMKDVIEIKETEDYHIMDILLHLLRLVKN